MNHVPLHLRRRRRSVFRRRYLLVVMAAVLLTPKLDMGKFPLLANWLPTATTAADAQRS
jgi:hypothetical protein